MTDFSYDLFRERTQSVNTPLEFTISLDRLADDSRLILCQSNGNRFSFNLARPQVVGAIGFDVGPNSPLEFALDTLP
jgi:hypothetical protein